ncbi:MAG: hypothetical protein K5978_00675, partial [Campylobacter sp.]|nr:hypothetical protein [Campylobacter sp.]
MIRKATKDDINDVFELSNEKSVRASGINPKPIDFNTHVKWFAYHLDNPDCVIYLYHKDGKLAGMCRLERVGLSMSFRRLEANLQAQILVKNMQASQNLKEEKILENIIKLSSNLQKKLQKRQNFIPSISKNLKCQSNFWELSISVSPKFRKMGIASK